MAITPVPSLMAGAMIATYGIHSNFLAARGLPLDAASILGRLSEGAQVRLTQAIGTIGVDPLREEHRLRIFPSLGVLHPGMEWLVGAKAVSLGSKETRFLLPTPPGFATDCHVVHAARQSPDSFRYLGEIIAGRLDALSLNTKFGDAENPLIVSVRSSPRLTMPGQLKSVLYVGMTSDNIRALSRRFTVTSKGHKVHDTQGVTRLMIRYVGHFAATVFDADEKPFRSFYDSEKRLNTRELNEQLRLAKEKFRETVRIDFPEDPWTQLFLSLEAVANSWDSSEARAYRAAHGIPEFPPLAILIQEQKFAALGDCGASGVAYTRDPEKGSPGLFGRFYFGRDGTNVMSGDVTDALEIKDLRDHEGFASAYRDLVDWAGILERDGRSPREIEWTVENGRLWTLQDRPAPLTPLNRVVTSLDLYREGVMTPAQAVGAVTPKDLMALQSSRYGRRGITARDELFSSYDVVVPGSTKGQLALGYQQARDFCWGERKRPYILVADHYDRAALDLVLGASGVIFMGDLPAHVRDTMLHSRVPSMANVGKRHRLEIVEGGARVTDITGAAHDLRTGQMLYLDTTYITGFATPRRLRRIPSPFEALLDETTDGAVLDAAQPRPDASETRRRRFLAVRDWALLRAAHQKEEGSRAPETDIEKALTEFEAIPDADAAKLDLFLGQRQWIRSIHGSETDCFVSRQAIEFLAAFFDRDTARPRRLPLWFYHGATYHHALVVSASRALPWDTMVQLLEEMTALGNQRNLAPGSCEYIVARIVSGAHMHQGPIERNLLPHLSDQALAFVIEEFAAVYDHPHGFKKIDDGLVLPKETMVSLFKVLPKRKLEQAKRLIVRNPKAADWL